MDARDSDDYKKYIKYMDGQVIPYTVLVDSSGKASHNWTGFQTYSQLVTDILKVSKSS